MPGIVPVAGQLDDAAAVILALKLALGGLPAGAQRQVLDDVGLTRGDLDEDLSAIGATYAWLGRQGAKLAWQGARAAARVGARLAGSVARRSVRR